MKFAKKPLTFLLDKESKPQRVSGKVRETARRGKCVRVSQLSLKS